MSKIFNVNADCQPNLHYMVDISGRLEAIKEMVDAQHYFTINQRLGTSYILYYFRGKVLFTIQMTK